MPIKGLVGDTLKRPHRSSSAGRAGALMGTGDQEDVLVMGRSAAKNHMIGTIPKHGRSWKEHPRQTGTIPGYCGHIAGKVSENMHGGTFGSENDRAIRNLPMRDYRRTLSAPDHLANYMDGKWDSRALKVASRIPGYMGTIPGKLSETVHGMRFGEANEMAQSLRNCNPHITSEGWLQKGTWPVDRMAQYKFHGKTAQCDHQPHFTQGEEQESYKSNQRLGEVFGLKPPKPSNYRPGDRYMHTFAPPKKARVDPSTYEAAGVSSYSTKLDPQRWLLHNALTIGNGNQRTAY